MKPKFAATETQIRATENLLAAMAFEETVRPIVEQYETAILEKHQFRIARQWVEHGCEDVPILDRKHSYLLSDEDAEVYFEECFAARDAANLKVTRPKDCPLLVAENLRMKAEQALFEAMSNTPGFEALKHGVYGLKERARAVDLMLNLLAPYCSNAQEILTRIKG